MLAIIEQRLCPDDRKVWSRELERAGKPATLEALIKLMTIEMKSRIRATAPLGMAVQSTEFTMLREKQKKMKFQVQGTNAGCAERQRIGRINARKLLE